METPIKVYLAIPYSGIREMSFRIANEVTAKLMDEGYVVFSPISHSHTLAQQETLPTDWEFWKMQDTEFVRWADEIHVVVIGENGYELMKNSVGVQFELQLAQELNKVIKHINYDGKHLKDYVHSIR